MLSRPSVRREAWSAGWEHHRERENTVARSRTVLRALYLLLLGLVTGLGCPIKNLLEIS